MMLPLKTEILGIQRGTIWRRGFKITRQSGEAQQNEKSSFVAVSHQIENTKTEREEWKKGIKENVAAVILSEMPAKI